MAEIIERLKTEAGQLPAQGRAELAYFLLRSLDDDADVESAWDAELNRRLHDIKSGRVGGRPAEEVFAKIQAKYS